MIRSRLLPLALCAIIASALVGCDWMPGKPNPANRWKPAASITDPATLFAQNCLACHSIGATTSAAIALNSPTFLAVIPPATLKDTITNGIPGSRMPAFVESKGGSLTAAQIDLLVDFILKNKKPIEGPLPPYAAPLGNAATGQVAFATFCASCHGGTGAGAKAGSIVDPDYLGLVTDQYLRTIVIAGRPELGCPDFRSRVPGRAMTDQDISDVVAWLASNRRNDLGQPLAAPNP
ncbi:MAG: c-type cytochrome [Terrimicrobiaceae bacterium]|nr:c-type cytochrome [Terrimicrobiaceae bacterium]